VGGGAVIVTVGILLLLGLALKPGQRPEVASDERTRTPPAAAPPASQTNPTPRSGPPLQFAQVRRREPVLTLTANGSGAVRVIQGWPLLVQAQLLHPDALGRAPINAMILAANEGPWTNALRLDVMDVKRQKGSWPWHLATAANPRIGLDDKTAALVGWWLEPAETAALAPGDYELCAVLETSAVKAADVWKGSARSRPVRIKLAAEPKVLEPEQEEEKALLLAQLARMHNDLKQALAHVDALLTKQPKSLAAMEFKGDLLAELGETRAALREYDGALARFATLRVRGLEPPRRLLDKQQSVLIKLLKE
jgi:hypothetical protein